MSKMETIESRADAFGPASGLLPGVPHPLRESLINELHARPYEALQPPVRASHLAVVTGESVETAREQHAHFVRLCARYDVAPPAESAKHFVQSLGPFRVRWERHTEFSTYTFLRGGPFSEPFVDPVINLVPRDWLQAIPGKVLVATHLALEDRDAQERDTETLSRLFNHHSLIGCRIAGGNAMVWTDLRFDENGFTRFLLRDINLHDRQAGRSVQRLLEIHTYSTMALLALPLAQEAIPRIGRSEVALSKITQALGVVRNLSDERALLAEITALAVDVERLQATTSYRFSACRAYYELVLTRVTELREQRVDGYQRLSVFLDRRLGPAMRTCESVRKRQEALGAHVVRASNLLRTRVDVALESQNQDLLQSMNRRAQLQLRLQATVEGLSVAAISYYVVGLIGDAAKALESFGLSPDPDLVMGVAIPFVVGIVWRGVRHVRRIAIRDNQPD
jgi:uncharacterized membrane-anchored protein